MEPINPSHYPASRAAGVATDYINYKMGTPNRLFQRQQVTSASKESIAGVGNKYHLTFPIKDFLNEQPEIMCTAEVLYYSDKNCPPDVKFTLQTQPQNSTATKDQAFYSRMMNNKEPLVAEDIPDKFGNVAPDMEPVWNLGIAAAGFIKSKNATEETLFAMTVIKKVTQVMKDNTALELHYDLLIHEMVSQEMIPWRNEITWNPSGGLKIISQQRLPKSH
ncbi:PREDICTED: latexin [Nanorana parkeri]|uniref:latexin n=1 Tax=Nanorana parkeri TaxID=125878 RepID=UPI00085477D3|nr:PREDICTED: latexin [Nanorana parkeri]